jgi:hypothetical protein
VKDSERLNVIRVRAENSELFGYYYHKDVPFLLDKIEPLHKEEQTKDTLLAQEHPDIDTDLWHKSDFEVMRELTRARRQIERLQAAHQREESGE